MDWWLTYRSQTRIENLSCMIDETQIAESKYFVEENNNIGFLELVKKD